MVNSCKSTNSTVLSGYGSPFLSAVSPVELIKTLCIPPIASKSGLPLSMTIVLTWYQLRKLAGSLRPSADPAAKGMMEPTTAADNRPSPALLLIRAHRAIGSPLGMSARDSLQQGNHARIQSL